MIFYFSGTGNSRWVAMKLAGLLHDQAVDMAYGLNGGMGIIDLLGKIEDDEPIGFVFPTYGWNIPRVVEQFIHSCQYAAKLVARKDSYNKDRYVYVVTTCGDDTGRMMYRFRKGLHKCLGLSLKSAWAVQMPNTYVCLPGFDVDSTEVQNKKMGIVPQNIQDIAASIVHRECGVWKVRPGMFPYAKTYLLGYTFRRWLMSPKPFHAVPDCVSCGKCEHVCPLHNIHLRDNHPVWDNNCTMCLSCYHHCPCHAIRYGYQGASKGQYLCKKSE